MAFWSDPSSLFPKQSHRWVVSLEHNASEASRRVPHYLAKSVDKPSYKIDTIQAKYLYSHTFNFPKRLVWNPIKIEFYDVFWLEKRGAEVYKTENNPQVSVGAVETTTKGYITREENRRLIGLKKPEEDTSKIPGGRTKTQLTEIVKSYAKTTQKFFHDFLQNSGYYHPNEDINDDTKLNRFRSYHFKKNMITALTGQTTELDLLNNNSLEYTRDYIYLAELDGDGLVIEEWKIYNPLITDITPGKLDYASDIVLSISVGITYDWAELTQFNRNAKPPTTKIESEP